MKVEFIESRKIIGMIDYPPLHSPETLATSYEYIKSGRHDLFIPIVVIPRNLVVSHFAKRKRFETYKDQWTKFISEHPYADFFMIDGKHRAAAATLFGHKVPCWIIKNDKDVEKLINLVTTKKIKITGLGINMEETIAILEEHFSKNKKFWTVEEKTKAMIAQGDIPSYMLN